MPLDYAIWQAIAKQVIDGAPMGVETKIEFLDLLTGVAKGLPKGYGESVIGRMKGNVLVLVDAKGYTPKND